MNNGTVIIFDEEKQYANHLMNYISNKKEIPFQTIAFTKEEKLIDYLEDNKADILLISVHSMKEKYSTLNAKQIVLLSEGRAPSEYSSYPFIYKYKSAEKIVREIIEKYIEINKGDNLLIVSEDNKAKVIGIYSPIGRSGKTTFALTLAQIISERMKTLFISLEEFAVFQEGMEASSTGNLADLMYYFKQNPETVSIKLQAIVQNINSLDYILPVYYSRDLREVNTKDWESLISAVAASNNYKCIVLDIGNMIGDLLSILNYCDEVYMPTVEDPVSELKIKQIENTILKSNHNGLMNKIIKTKVPLLDQNQLEYQKVETLGMSNIGDYIRALIKREQYESN